VTGKLCGYPGCWCAFGVLTGKAAADGEDDDDTDDTDDEWMDIDEFPDDEWQDVELPEDEPESEDQS